MKSDAPNAHMRLDIFCPARYAAVGTQTKWRGLSSPRRGRNARGVVV